MEDTITELQDEVKLFKQALDKRSGKSSVVKGKIQSQSANRTSVKFILSPSEELSLESSTPAQDLTLAVEDVANAKTCQESSTQTYDTAFIPCEANAQEPNKTLLKLVVWLLKFVNLKVFLLH